MSDNTLWETYAKENLAVATLSLNARHFNACLQNAQQAVEKFLSHIAKTWKRHQKDAQH